MTEKEMFLSCDGAKLTVRDWNRARRVLEGLQYKRYASPEELDEVCKILKCQ